MICICAQEKKKKVTTICGGLGTIKENYKMSRSNKEKENSKGKKEGGRWGPAEKQKTTGWMIT